MGILQKLRAGKNNRRAVRVPETDEFVDLCVLSDAEEQEAEFAAESLYTAAGITIAFHNITEFQLEVTTQKLYRALRVIGTDTPIEPDIVTFKKNLTRGQRDFFIDELNAHIEQCNPAMCNMPIAEFDALLEQLKKKPQETILSVLSISTLRKLALYLAKIRLSSPEDSGSTFGQ